MKNNHAPGKHAAATRAAALLNNDKAAHILDVGAGTGIIGGFVCQFLLLLINLFVRILISEFKIRLVPRTHCILGRVKNPKF